MSNSEPGIPSWIKTEKSYSSDSDVPMSGRVVGTGLLIKPKMPYWIAMMDSSAVVPQKKFIFSLVF
ncbi:hypothetical protein BB561_005635 [Smittium simulii]|uniref:Uncharacterized protein n=1 Tax=Smittium simulii TaxID=133385 RepID=A0A2T9Y9E8_9FUNG|nr:hypothetical protein BB561_005635 [Smittium simulii]